MKTPLLAALALACALPLAACDPSDLSALRASGLSPTLTPGTLTPESMSAAGVPAKTQARILKSVRQVQTAATRICPFLPLAEGIANVFIAKSSASANVQGVASLTCKALTAAPTYAALGSRKGEPVRGHLLINGFDVPVYGTRLR